MARGPQMGGSSGGGFHYDDTNKRNQDDEQTAQALNRGALKPGYIVDSTSTFRSAQSKEQTESQAYERDAGYTRAQMSRKEEANIASLKEAAKNIGDIKPPSQPQPEQEQVKQSSQEQPRQSRSPFDTPENKQRQFDLSARLRGRMDAMEANGIETFGDRKDFGSQRMFNIAKESYQKTSQAIEGGKFRAMSERTRAAIENGNTQEQGQSQSAGASNAPSGKTLGTFGAMSNRVAAAIQSKKADTAKSDGLEQR
jgi:hypothetical protein